MSGFEVAGLILGVYPLIITLLAAYKETKSGRGARRLAQNLDTERAIFGDFVYHLLAPNVPEADLVRLTDQTSPDLELWKDTTLQKKLKSRLGDEKAKIVVETLRETKELLSLLQVELTPGDHKLDLIRRFRGSLRNARNCQTNSSLQERLRRLTDCNYRLERLLADRSFISNANYRKTSAPLKQYLRRDSSCVTDLYNAIYDGYRCNCDAPHVANFCLPRVSQNFGVDNNDWIDSGRFELLFPVGISGIANALPTSTLRSINATDNPTASTTRRVSIHEYNDNSKDGKQGPIHDLCNLLRSLDANKLVTNTRLGILKLKEKQYELQAPVCVAGLASSQNIVCLDQLLTSQQFKLPRKERIGLALSLSYAVLQFYSTPWIEASWTWQDFCIDKQNGSHGQLFVTRKFYSSRSRDSAVVDSKSLSSGVWAICGEPILIKLGFALIELALETRLAELREETHPKTGDPDMLDILTAKKLVESGRIMREEGRAYDNVVKACLYHQFICSSRPMSIDSSQPTFQKDVEQCIIEPLHSIWTIHWGNIS